MRNLDQRGSTALEFCIAGAAIFILMFAIFDLGRFAITYQSLRSLANASARATMLSSCYSSKVTTNQDPDTCTGDYLTPEEKQAAAPFLYMGSSSPSVSTAADGTALVVTASMPFKMLVDMWGTSLDDPSVSTRIPY